MKQINIDEEVFEKVFNKMVSLYKMGYLQLLDISDLIVSAEKNGYKLNYNFNLITEIPKEIKCDCNKHFKIMTNSGFICSNCKKQISTTPIKKVAL